MTSGREIKGDWLIGGMSFLLVFPALADDTMTITANRFLQPVSSVLAPVDVVTREDIERQQAKTVTDVLKRLPGVTLSRNGGMGQASSLYVRGTEAQHVLLLVDGIPVPRSGIMNMPDFSQIPLSIVQRIEFVRGARSAVYGSAAIGGVVNIITKHDEDYSQADVGIGSNGYHEYGLGLNKRINDTVVTVAGNYEGTKGYEITPISSWAGDHTRKGYHNKSFYAGISHKFNEHLNTFFRGYGYSGNTDYSQGDFGFAGGNNKLQNYTKSFDTGLEFNQGIYSSELKVSYQDIKDYNYNNEIGPYAGPATLDHAEQQYVSWGHNAVVGHGVVGAGIDWKREKLTSQGNSFDLVPVYSIEKHQRNNTGLYLMGLQQFGDVTLEASGREDHDPQFGWEGTWQTSAGWQFADDYRVTLSYGTAFLAPSLGQQYGATRFNIMSNPALKPEGSKQWEIGLAGLTGPIDWRLAAYHYKINNLIDYKMGEGSMGGTGFYYNVNSATMKGVELTGGFDTGPIHHNVTWQYTDPRNDETGKTLARRAKQQVKYELSGNIYNLGWDINYNYIGSRHDTDFKTFQPVEMGGVSVWDAGLSVPVTTALTARGSVTNLMDKKYQTADGYMMAGREFYLNANYRF